ncbi:MAG: hypothetical protein ACT6TH_01315 [Brevundimonas sp.]|uniref:hypothetical protein n=1 Tax=Brevundimonas sp. TaxID=1871086 RepID=UPI0040341E8B
MTNRRAVLAALCGGLGLTACARESTAVRRDVIAAGQPAAILVWSVARDRLAAWPDRPPPEALRALPPEAATLGELGRLSGPGRAALADQVAALRASQVIDYGDLDNESAAAGRKIGDELGLRWTLIDGALTGIPAAFRQAGALLDDARRGESLATRAEAILRDWRSVPAGPSFYYAREDDGLETGFRGALATEVLEGGRWTNVAVDGDHVGRVTLDQIQAWDPEVIVTQNRTFARVAQTSSAWRVRRDGSRRRVLLIPDTPFGWLDRPPSVNRLLGCAWLASPADPAMSLSLLSRNLYGMAPSEIGRPRWLV